MAQCIGDAEPRRRVTYPWADWMNGKTWRATQGEDFDTSPQSFQTALHQRARSRGFDVVTGSPEPGVIEFRFTPEAEAEPAPEAEFVGE